MNKTVLIVGAVAIGLFLWTRRADAKGDLDTPPEDKEKYTPPEFGGIGEVVEGVPNLPPGLIITPRPTLLPGNSASNPIPSSALTPGFEGYFLVQTGDSMIKIARRLGLPDRDWRLVRDEPRNLWAVIISQAHQGLLDRYSNGEKSILLYARYGRTVGTDCNAPGYEARFHTANTGQFPVLYTGGGYV